MPEGAEPDGVVPEGAEPLLAPLGAEPELVSGSDPELESPDVGAEPEGAPPEAPPVAPPPPAPMSACIKFDGVYGKVVSERKLLSEVSIVDLT